MSVRATVMFIPIRGIPHTKNERLNRRNESTQSLINAEEKEESTLKSSGEGRGTDENEVRKTHLEFPKLIAEVAVQLEHVFVVNVDEVVQSIEHGVVPFIGR